MCVCVCVQRILKSALSLVTSYSNFIRALTFGEFPAGVHRNKDRDVFFVDFVLCKRHVTTGESFVSQALVAWRGECVCVCVCVCV